MVHDLATIMKAKQSSSKILLKEDHEMRHDLTSSYTMEKDQDRVEAFGEQSTGGQIQFDTECFIDQKDIYIGSPMSYTIHSALLV